MQVLGIDLGLTAGWCWFKAPDLWISGVIDLRGGRFEGGGMRFFRWDDHLSQLLDRGPACVVYEEVRRHLGTSAAHCYGALYGILTSACERRRIPYAAIPVGTIKRIATGKGNADKRQMVASANKRWPTANIKNDNEADARWCVASYLHAKGVTHGWDPVKQVIAQ